MSHPINPNPIGLASQHCVSPFGTESEDLWKACLSGQPSFTDGFGRISQKDSEHCKNFVKQAPLKESHVEGYLENPIFDWTVYSLFQAMGKAGWSELTHRDGIIISTTTSFIMYWEDKLMHYLRGEPIEGKCYQTLGAFPKALQESLGHDGPCTMVSSACSASTQAVGMARQWIHSGYVDRCVVIGAEQLCHLTSSGFKALSLVTDEVCHPFNEDFAGISLSEAAAVLCLEKINPEKEYNSFVTGYGCVSDAYSMTSPKPDGSGPAGAMATAIQQAQLSPKDIDWVYAHGTGSLPNDRAEAAAMLKLEMIKNPVSSTKGVHGHTLAASGALEIAISDFSLKEQKRIPSWKSSPEHYNINVLQKDSGEPLRHILKNSLGFGGINASVVISKEVSQ